MTIGTNANLEELIKYSPQEIDFDFILAELKELEEWRELLGNGEYSVDDVKLRISEQEDSIAEKDRDIEDLEVKVAELSEEISYLNNRVEELGLTIEDYETEIERLKETIDDMISSG